VSPIALAANLVAARPEVRDNVAAVIVDLLPAYVAELYLDKAWDWNTETECSLLVHGSVSDYEYVDITDSLVGMFLGPRFPRQRIRDVKAGCRAVRDAKRVPEIGSLGS
jgi:hypothetical protein